MSLLSRVLIVISILQLFHAGFSSSEFHVLLKTHLQNSSVTVDSSLPLDIKLEVVMSLVLFTLGIFISFEKLEYYPIRGDKSVIKTSHYLRDIEFQKAVNVNNLVGSDPNGEVTYTPNLVDVCKKRQEYKDWEINNSKN